MRQGTYSIVAHDPATGQVGVAVQSHWFSVGSIVTWARAGVGAVATQSVAEPAYGPGLLDALEGGAAPDDALARLLAEDGAREVRQVAVADATGRVAVHTGAGCIPFAGHERGDGFSVQANMMASGAVWGAMAKAFREADPATPLPERLLAALDAAEAAGGDVRGRQSAALLVLPAAPDPSLRETVELRVEDAPDPLGELRRLLVLHRAYELATAGDDLVAQGLIAEAGERYAAAAELAPGNDELLFWAGLAAFDRGEPDAGLVLLHRALEISPRWRQLLDQLPEHIAPSAPAALRALNSA